MSEEHLENIFVIAAELRKKYDKHTLALYLASDAVSRAQAKGSLEQEVGGLMADLDKIKGTKKPHA